MLAVKIGVPVGVVVPIIGICLIVIITGLLIYRLRKLILIWNSRPPKVAN